MNEQKSIFTGTLLFLAVFLVGYYLGGFASRGMPASVSLEQGGHPPVNEPQDVRLLYPQQDEDRQGSSEGTTSILLDAAGGGTEMAEAHYTTPDGIHYTLDIEGSIASRVKRIFSTDFIENESANVLLAARGGKTDTGGSGGGGSLPSCLSRMATIPALADYVTYLVNHSSVVRAMKPCNQPVGTISWFIKKLEEIEATGLAPSAPLPDNYHAIDPDRQNFVQFGAQTDEIMGAKLAHILWLDVRQKVPWRLTDYSSSDLTLIFELCKICANNVLDYSPRVAWELINEKIDLSAVADTKAALVELTKHTRDFRHGGAFYDLNGNLVRDDSKGIVTLDQMAEERVSRHGCWSMVPYLLQLAEAMNIPAESEYGYYAAGGHLTAIFRSNDMVLAHGDDPYDALLGDTPSRTLFDTYARWAREVLRYKTFDVTAGYNSKIHNYENMRLYPAQYLMSRYCAKTGTARRAYLEEVFTTFATASQLNDLESRISTMTSNCASVPEDNPDAGSS